MIVSLLIATYISAATAQAPVKTVTPQLSASPVDEIERILAAPADTLPSRIAEPQALPTVTAAVADSLRSRMPAALDRDSLFNYIPERYTRDPVYDQTLPAEDAWWSSFSDPTLTGLIASGQDYNYNLASALKRIAIARNSLKGIKSAYWPTITASGGWNASHQSSRTTAHLADSPTLTYFSLGLAASWEIDVFGRIAEQAKAGQAQVQMSRAQYDAAMVSVAANIADSYFTLRECQARQQVVREHISQQQEILKMVEVRKETGLASGLDVSQARQVLLTSEAMLTEIKADIRTSLNSLATLTGRFPGSLTQSLINPAALPSPQSVTPVGIPQELLRRRPDVAEAEAQVALCAARCGIAKKDYLPTLSITAEAGTDAHRFDKLFSSHSFGWNVAPQISWTAFDGLSRKYALTEARLQLESAVDDYNNTLLTATQEVENAMVSYTAALETIDNYEAIRQQADKTLELSLDLYKQGLTSFSDVADAQISSLEARNSLIAARGEALTALVSLYQALGGGWTPANPE